MTLPSAVLNWAAFLCPYILTAIQSVQNLLKLALSVRRPLRFFMPQDKRNPLTYLIKKMWHYSGDNRPKVALYTTLFVFSNIIASAEPLLVGIVLNIIQLEGVTSANIYSIALLPVLLLVKELIFWAFHGPARVMENRNAFIVRANYKNFLLDGTMALPIEWHTDHHSGETIDKVEKGSSNLFSLSERYFLKN